MFAQAMIEKGALDGMSTGMTQLRYRMTEIVQDERALYALAIAFVLFLVWRVRRG
jgi:hypothetical protein